MRIRKLVLRFTGLLTVAIGFNGPDGLISADEQAVVPAVTSVDANPQVSKNAEPPAIPYNVLNQAISGSGFGSHRIQLTAEQKTAIQQVHGHDYLISTFAAQLTNHGSNLFQNYSLLDQAIALRKQDEEDLAAGRILTLLTNEQIAEIRTKSRGAILDEKAKRLSRDVPDLPANRRTLDYIGTLLSRGDLLCLLEGTDTLDLLQLTDEQFQAYQEVRAAAWPEAMALAAECFTMLQDHEVAKNQPIPVKAVAETPMQILIDDTLAVLTKEQRDAYQKSVEEKFRKLQENPPKDAAEAMAAYRQHGMPIEIRTEIVNGKSTIALRLYNHFAVPEHAAELKITDEQQKKIAEYIAKAETDAATQMSVGQDTENRKQSELQAKISERVSAYHKKHYDLVTVLLTEDQMQLIQQRMLHQLGVLAINRPEVREQLKLSESQIADIEAVMTRPMHQPNPTMVISEAETRKQLSEAPKTEEEARKRFEKHSKEFNDRIKENDRRFRIYSEQRHRDIWNILTEEQRTTFSMLTGVTAPPPSEKGI